jgi:hypothetical protein
LFFGGNPAGSQTMNQTKDSPYTRANLCSRKYITKKALDGRGQETDWEIPIQYTNKTAHNES